VFTGFRGGVGHGAPGAGFADGLIPSAIVHAVTFRVTGRWGGRWGVDLRGSYAKNDSSLTDRGTRTFVATARLDRKLADRVYLFATADVYRQNISLPGGVPLKRTRAFGGVEFILSPRPAPSFAGGAAIEDKGRNVLLPEAVPIPESSGRNQE